MDLDREARRSRFVQWTAVAVMVLMVGLALWSVYGWRAGYITGWWAYILIIHEFVTFMSQALMRHAYRRADRWRARATGDALTGCQVRGFV